MLISVGSSMVATVVLNHKGSRWLPRCLSSVTRTDDPVKGLYARGVSRIIIGELGGIRNGDDHHGRQVNAMIHNYWSQKHVADRLTWAAEEYGIKVETISEAYTSQTCSRCGSEALRDAVGVLNMAARCGGYAVRPMVWPMLLRWDGCGWNRNKGMLTQ